MTARKAAIGEVAAEMFVPPERPWADSFEDLFRKESLGMVRLAFLMVGSVPLAEEIVQDAFARVLERWERIDQPVAYLRTSVVKGWKNAHRRRAPTTVARLPGEPADLTLVPPAGPRCWSGTDRRACAPS